MRAIVRAGLLAPSGDNCQPWRFRWDGARLAVLFDPDRAESFYDVDNAASWISLGAVLENMAVAAQAKGLALSATLFPSDAPADVVARCTLREGGVVDGRLAAAIEARCVNRRRYDTRPVPRDVRTSLEALAKAPAHLSWVEDARAKSALAALAAENERLLFEHRELHRGLFRWLRWSRAETDRTGDGLPIETLELARWERPGFRLLGRWTVARALAALGMTGGLAIRSRQIYTASGAIALLSVASGGREAYVLGGRILEQIWLVATNHGLAFQPITGITFLLLRMALTGGQGLSEAHRRRLQRAADNLSACLPEASGKTPIMLFRLGFAPPASGRTPRRPLDEVLLWEKPQRP